MICNYDQKIIYILDFIMPLCNVITDNLEHKMIVMPIFNAKNNFS